MKTNCILKTIANPDEINKGKMKKLMVTDDVSTAVRSPYLSTRKNMSLPLHLNYWNGWRTCKCPEYVSI